MVRRRVPAREKRNSQSLIQLLIVIKKGNLRQKRMENRRISLEIRQKSRDLIINKK